MKIPAFAIQEFRSELEAYVGSDHKKACDVFNWPLYEAFRKFRPEILDKPTLKALFGLIDKSYSAGLGRSYQGESDGYYIDHIVDTLLDHQKSELSDVLATAASLKDGLSRGNCFRASESVEHLVSLLCASGCARRPVSFSSKFLHFYSNGTVPIWDEFARNSIANLMGRKHFKGLYPDYVESFIELCEGAFLVRQFSPVQVKQVDDLLMWMSGSWKALDTASAEA